MLNGPLQKDTLQRTKVLLEPLLPDVFNISYLPDMPKRQGGTASLFQVVFMVGPRDDAMLREIVHSLFEQMLIALSAIPLVLATDVISLRARRRIPESPLYQPDHGFMFIESSWSGAAIATMRDDSSYSSWAQNCLEYHNKFDKNDPLTRHCKNNSAGQ
jgi:hypothetical protein